MNRIVLSTALAAIGIGGCARGRDLAVVEPTLSRHYQGGPTALVAANPPATSGNVVGIQPVAGQNGVVKPVYQSPPPVAAAGAVGNVALPPASSTGTQAEGQPYYAPPVQNVAAVPPSPPPSLPPSTGVVAAPGGVPAGVYPAAASGMWMPTKGNQSIAIHQFSTPTTGSSFIPSTTSAGTAALSHRTGDGVIPAGAFMSAIPTKAPPPQTTRILGMSETGENMQPTRLPEKRVVAGPPAELEARTSTPLPKGEVEQPIVPLPKPSEPRPLPPPVARTKDEEPRPNTNQRKPGEDQPAPGADPSRVPRRPSQSENTSPPKSIDLPQETNRSSKTGNSSEPKKDFDLAVPPSAPKKLPPKKEMDDPPLGKLPDDDLSPPPPPPSKKPTG